MKTTRYPNIFARRRMMRQAEDGVTRRVLPKDISLMSPPKPTLEALQDGQTQYLLPHPTEVFRLGFRRVFQLTLLLCTLGLIILPVQGLSASVLLVKLTAALVLWCAVLVYLSLRRPWARSRPGSLLLGVLALSSVAGLLLLPSSASPRIMIAALVTLMVVAYNDDASAINRGAAKLKKEVRNFGSHWIPDLERLDSMLVLAGYALRIALAIMSALVLISSHQWTVWPIKLALVIQLAACEKIFVESSRLTAQFADGIAPPASADEQAGTALKLIWITSLAILVVLPLENWRHMALKAVGLGLVGIWIRARWGYLKWKSKFEFYSFDDKGWELALLLEGRIPVPESQWFGWPDISDSRFRHLSLFTWALGFNNGVFDLDTKGTKPNITNANLSYALDARELIRLYDIHLGETAEANADAVRRERILKWDLQGMPWSELRGVLPGPDYEGSYRALVEAGLIRTPDPAGNDKTQPVY